MKNLIFILGILAFTGCQLDNDRHQSIALASAITEVLSNPGTDNRFGDYWYQGKAEVSRYVLSQNRYGDNHPGEIIMIFVTEDFLPDKQVKNDRQKSGSAISVLKNNLIRQFTTGFYDYSMMSSVFTPVQRQKYSNTLKVTTSSQDWCGQTFHQINWRDRNYVLQSRSYFESEGDLDTNLGAAFLEDEIFNQIRLNPEGLPTGSFKIIPSTQISRLTHFGLKPVDAIGSKSTYTGDDFEGTNLEVYQVEFDDPEYSRKLKVVYEVGFPYKIEGWMDSYPSKFDKTIRTTIAKKTHERYTAYWKENKLKDMHLRPEFGRVD